LLFIPDMFLENLSWVIVILVFQFYLSDLTAIMNWWWYAMRNCVLKARWCFPIWLVTTLEEMELGQFISSQCQTVSIVNFECEFPMRIAMWIGNVNWQCEFSMWIGNVNCNVIWQCELAMWIEDQVQLHQLCCLSFIALFNQNDFLFAFKFYSCIICK